MSTNAGVQKASIGIALFGWTLYFVGLVFCARFFPPPDPGDSAEQVAALYRDHQDRIRLGAVLMFAGAGFTLFLVAAISHQMRRMTMPAASSLLAQVQLGAGALGSFMLIWSPGMFVAASFRPEERSPETLSALHDLAWLAFVAASTWAVAQTLAVGIAVLAEPHEQRVYPRWLGYLSLWTAVLLLPAPLDVCFTSGIFAWNGLVPWWIATVAYGAWFGSIILLTLKAIDAEESSATAQVTRQPQAVA